MANENVLDLLTQKYKTFTKSGKKLTDYVLANADEVQYLSISSLAEESGVAEATISRFCQTLGFSGYSGFKLALAKAEREIRGGDLSGIWGKVTAEDSVSDMCRKLYSADVAAITETLDLVDEGAVTRAARLLLHAPHVYCFGQGGSLIIAMEAWARFLTVASQFECVQDSHMQAMTAALAQPDDVFLFVSYSGATRDMMDVLQIAHQRGAKIILLTHFAKSPGAVYADEVLLCGSKERPLQSGSMAVKMGLLFLIDILYTEYCRCMPAETEGARNITAAVVADKML